MINPKLLTVNDKIKFKLLDPKYGRAMFDICPMFKNKYLRSVFIYEPIQKREFLFNIPKDMKISVFTITAWSHKTPIPNIWREFWCKEHKALCHQVYAPDKTNTITFEYNFGDSFTIRFEGGTKNG